MIKWEQVNELKKNKENEVTRIKWEGKNEMNRREWSERRREKEEETMTVKKNFSNKISSIHKYLKERMRNKKKCML